MLLTSIKSGKTMRDGKGVDTSHQPEESDNDNSISDDDILKALQDVNHASVNPNELALRARDAMAVRLPAVLAEEEDLLAEEYDSSKLNDANHEESANFSGGEWAKIGTSHARFLSACSAAHSIASAPPVLARTFLRPNVDLLIIDEFSAALDPVSEAAIFSKFLTRRGQLTTLAVTHRFHLACKSDMIIFMRAGDIIETGTHAELMAREGEYMKMYACTVNTAGISVGTQTEEEVLQFQSTEEEHDRVR